MMDNQHHAKMSLPISLTVAPSPMVCYMKASNRARFGRIVRERRMALGMTQDDIAAAGGPSDTTQTRIEKAEGHEPSATTRKLFRWRHR